MASKKRKKSRSHYCWCCRRTRPNEKFSAKGHARHLCRECAELGPEELAYQQALRDMARCVGLNGRVFKKRRKQFEAFLYHEDPRIRAAAEERVSERPFAEEEWRGLGWEYECYRGVEEALRILEREQAAINLELAEAAELDRPASDLECSVCLREESPCGT